MLATCFPFIYVCDYKQQLTEETQQTQQFHFYFYFNFFVAASVSVTLTVRDHVFMMARHAAVRSSHFTVKIYGLVLNIALVKREVIEMLLLSGETE